MAYNPLKDVKEDVIIKEVKAVIELTGLSIQRINSGAFTIDSGVRRRFIRAVEHTALDFEGYDNHGRFVGIECKRPVGGRLSDAQRIRIEDINRKGGIAFVARSGQEALQQLKKNGCL